MNNLRFNGYGQRFDFLGLFKGNSFDFEFTVNDKRVDPCIPFDFTYYQEAILSVYKQGHTKEYLRFETSDSSIVLSSGSIALYKASINLEGEFIYNLQLTDSNNDVFSWLYGKFEVLPVKGIINYPERMQTNQTVIEFINPSASFINLNIN